MPVLPVKLPYLCLYRTVKTLGDLFTVTTTSGGIPYGTVKYTAVAVYGTVRIPNASPWLPSFVDEH